MTEQLGDGPIENEYVKGMQTVASTLDAFFNDGKRGADRTTGFVLLVFPFGSSDGRCNYISNGAARVDIIALLREQADRFENQMLGDT